MSISSQKLRTGLFDRSVPSACSSVITYSLILARQIQAFRHNPLLKSSNFQDDQCLSQRKLQSR